MYGSGRMLGCHRDLYDPGLRDLLDETATPGRNLMVMHPTLSNMEERRTREIDELEKKRRPPIIFAYRKVTIKEANLVGTLEAKREEAKGKKSPVRRRSERRPLT